MIKAFKGYGSIILGPGRQFVLPVGAGTRQPRQKIFLLHLCVLPFLIFFLSTPSLAQNIAVVVNPSVSVQKLSLNALRALFGMRLRVWDDGAPVTVFVLDDKNPTHRLFAKSKLNILPHQLRKSWDRLVFSGTGQAPIHVSSLEEMRVKVSSTPGAIGYLRSDLIDDSIQRLEID